MMHGQNKTSSYECAV